MKGSSDPQSNTTAADGAESAAQSGVKWQCPPLPLSRRAARGRFREQLRAYLSAAAAEPGVQHDVLDL